MRRYQSIAFVLALAAVVALALSGPGTKQGWFGWRMGLMLFQGGAWMGLAAIAMGSVGILLLTVPKWRMRPWMPVATVILGMIAAAPPLVLMWRSYRVPAIHDITTDFADPPAFAALAAIRDDAPNKAAYGGEAVAAQQRDVYVNINPKRLALPPEAAMQKCIDAARALGWEIVASDVAAGRIEATDTTRWFGFKDDIVVRLRPEGAVTRIDVRSASRVGRSDIGANALRIRAFLAQLD